MVIVPPLVELASLIPIPVPPEKVTALEPLVLVVNVAVLAPPAPTPKRPSLVIDPSTSVDVMVKLGYVPETDVIPAPVNDTVTSGAVFATVKFGYAPVTLIAAPELSVTV
jgi:hypothetical protein